MDPTRMMDFFMLAIGVYILYAGITGKGKMMYKDDTIHRSQKENFFKTMRLFGLIAGPLCIASSVLTMNKYFLAGNIVAGGFAVVLIVIIVRTIAMSDRRVKKRCDKLGLEEPTSDGFAEEREAKENPQKHKSQESSQNDQSSAANLSADENTDDIRFY